MKNSAAIFSFCFLYSGNPTGGKKSICQHSINSIPIRNKYFTSLIKGRYYHIKGLYLNLTLITSIYFAQETSFGGYWTRKILQCTWKTPQSVICYAKIFKFLRFFLSFLFSSLYLPKAVTHNSPSLLH